MDYYLIEQRGLLAEEFVRRNDFTTAGLRSSDAALSRLVRTDPDLAAVAVTSEQARGAPPPRDHEEFPSAPPPRDHEEFPSAPPLRDYEEFPSAPMLALTPSEPLPGFREKRLYRVLFARQPLKPEPEPDGELAEGGDSYSWSLHRIAGGIAWCLDLTAHLNEGTTLGRVLVRLTDEMRLRHGLIPVTTERFQ